VYSVRSVSKKPLRLSAAARKNYELCGTSAPSVVKNLPRKSRYVLAPPREKNFCDFQRVSAGNPSVYSVLSVRKIVAYLRRREKKPFAISARRCGKKLCIEQIL